MSSITRCIALLSLAGIMGALGACRKGGSSGAPAPAAPAPFPDGGSLVFSGVTATARNTSAVIRWESNEPATGQVEYGLSDEYGAVTAEANTGYAHWFEIAGLLPGTVYHFRIRARDRFGNGTLSADYTFTTLAQADWEATVRAARGAGDLPKTYYVRTDGSDANDGLTLATAWQRPSYAAQRAEAGDVVYLADGVWLNEHVVLTRSGVPEAPIAFRAYGGTPTLDGVDRTGSGFEASTASLSWVEIDGLTIRNYEHGVSVLCYSAGTISDFLIRNCTISNTPGNGIGFRAWGSGIVRNVTVLANEISSAGSGYWTAAVSFMGVYNALVKANRVLHCAGAAVFNYPAYDSVTEDNYMEDIGQHAVDHSAGTHGNTVRNNTLINGHARGIRFDYVSTGNKVIGNTVRDVADSGLNLYPDWSGEVRSNHFENVSVVAVGIADTLFENNVWKGSSINIVSSDSSLVGPRNCRNVVFRNNVCFDVLANRGVWLSGWENGTIANNIFANSRVEFTAVPEGGGIVAYNDFWNSPYAGATPAANSLSADPLFADPAAGDFHLRSTAGRWSGAGWVLDDVTSLCIDAGDPGSPFGKEPSPNGARINMGAYGNSPQASKSP